VLSETTSGATSRYVYGLDLLEQIDPAGNPAFYHADGLGSTRALSDASGQRTDAYSYDVFGAVRSHAGGSGQSFGFAGEQEDSELGLIFLRARYLDMETGRFTTRDPHPGFMISPQSLNKYVYAANNPVLMKDESGEAILPVIVLGAVGLTAVLEWNNFVGYVNQKQSYASGYYQTNFLDPKATEEWTKKYYDTNYNFDKEWLSAYGPALKAYVSTPGTLSSIPPGSVTGSIGKPSFISMILKKIMTWMFLRPDGPGGGDVLGASDQRSVYRWGAPPSKGK